MSVFLSTFLNGQNSLTSFTILGPDYKIIKAGKDLKFTVQLEFGKLFPSKKGIESNNGGSIETLQQTIYADPQLFEKLFESLGGEFFIGSFSEAPKFENFKQKSRNYFGLSGAFRFHPRFEIETQFGAYQTEVTAEFPIVIFDNYTFETTSTKGKIKSGLKSKVIQTSGNFYPLNGKVQPFLGVGVVYHFIKSSVTKAEMESVEFAFFETPKSQSFGLVLKGGIAVEILKNVVLTLEGQAFTISKAEGNDWNKMLNGGIGIRF